MKRKAAKNRAFFKSRNRDVLKSYRQAIGSPGVFVVVAVLVLEVLCFAADLMAFGLLFGQVMGDTKGMVAAGSISLLFPLVAFFGFQGLSSRFLDQRKRERLAVALLVAMGAFLLAVLAIRFPLEAVATSDEGADWLVTALVYCLPPLSSIIGALAASLTLHNPQVKLKTEQARLHAKIANVKAELAALEGNDPARFRAHVENVYRAAYCEVDGLMDASLSTCVGLLVQRHGMGVHDHLGSLFNRVEAGSERYDTRPAAFARKANDAPGRQSAAKADTPSAPDAAPAGKAAPPAAAGAAAAAAPGATIAAPAHAAQVADWGPQVHVNAAGAKIA